MYTVQWTFLYTQGQAQNAPKLVQMSYLATPCWTLISTFLFADSVKNADHTALVGFAQAPSALQSRCEADPQPGSEIAITLGCEYCRSEGGGGGASAQHVLWISGQHCGYHSYKGAAAAGGVSL